MAPRKTYQRQILSSNYAPSVSAEAGIYEQQMQGSSSMAKMLSQMSGFFYDQMTEKVVEEGEMYGAANPITIEEIKKAQQTGENVVGRLGYGLKGKAARGTALQILQNEIEIEARREFQNVTNEAIKQNIPYEELADSLDAITIGYTKLLGGVDPKIAYNVKGNLSVISNDLYSKYADDQIKKENNKNTLREMFALEEDIQTIKPTLKQFIKGGDPKAILTWTERYRQGFEEVILNSNLTDAKKRKFKNESQDLIDDVITETLVEYSLDNNIALSTLIKNEIKDKGKQSGANIIYNIKNPDISSLVNSLSTKGINNIVSSLNKKLEEINAQKKIDLDQSITETQIEVDQLDQDLKVYFDSYKMSDGEIDINIQGKIEELQFLNKPLYDKYKTIFKSSRMNFATRPNLALETRIEQEINENPDLFEITDLIEEKPNLSQEFFETMKKEIAANQQTEYKEFLKEVTTNRALATEFPELVSILNESSLALLSTPARQEEFARKRIMQDFLKLEAAQSVREGRAFNPVDALRKFKKDPDNKKLLADPLRRKETLMEVSSEHFKNFITPYQTGLRNTGLFKGLKYPEDIQDTKEFYSIIAKNYFENENVKTSVTNFFTTNKLLKGQGIDKQDKRAEALQGFVSDLKTRAEAFEIKFEE